MKVVLENKPAFSFFGIEAIISMDNGQNFIDVPAFWQTTFQNGDFDKLESVSGSTLKDTEPGLLPVNAIMCYEELPNNHFPYMIGCFDSPSSKSEGYKKITVSEGLWAVFTTELYDAAEPSTYIQDVWKAIFATWFPENPYIHGPLPELEVYYRGENNMEYCEVWIPVIPK